MDVHFMDRQPSCRCGSMPGYVQFSTGVRRVLQGSMCTGAVVC